MRILEAVQIAAPIHDLHADESYKNGFAFKILLSFSAFVPGDHSAIEHPFAAQENQFVIIQDSSFKDIKIIYMYLPSARVDF